MGAVSMDGSLQIHFHGMETSPALEAKIRERFGQLERRCPKVTGCRVTVEKENRNHVKGNLFRVGLLMHRPGRDVVVSRGGPKDHGHADVYAALRDTFDAAERQLAELDR
jgi:ribosome-associated translation inhibitor RaiA